MENTRKDRVASKVKSISRRRIWLALCLLLSLVVASGVFLNMMQPAITMTAICGKEEHVHSDSCYKDLLFCENEDVEHVHDDSCYARVLICGLEEHTHTEACYPASAQEEQENLPELEAPAHVEASSTENAAVGSAHEEAVLAHIAYLSGPDGDVAAGRAVTLRFEASGAELSYKVEEKEMGRVADGSLAAGQTHCAFTPEDAGSYTFTLTAKGTDGDEVSRSLSFNALRVEPLVVSVERLTYSVHAGEEAAFRVRVSGGLAPLSCEVKASQGGETFFVDDAVSETMKFRAYDLDKMTILSLEVRATDALGETKTAKADVLCAVDRAETREAWEKPFEDLELTGNWAADALTIARLQKDYAESGEDFIVDEEGRLQGWTRYGAWYGDPYGDWSAMYAAFCLNYAGVDKNAFPWNKNAEKWQKNLTEMDLFARDAEQAVAGDLVLLDLDADEYGQTDGKADHVGILTSVDEKKIKALVGDAEADELKNAVVELEYETDDVKVLGYGLLDLACLKAMPTATPTVAPTATPTVAPTATPTVAPTATPTVAPTATPTVEPTATPTVEPTATPTIEPTVEPTATPTIEPTLTAEATELDAEETGDEAEASVSDETDENASEPADGETEAPAADEATEKASGDETEDADGDATDEENETDENGEPADGETEANADDETEETSDGETEDADGEATDEADENTEDAEAVVNEEPAETAAAAERTEIAAPASAALNELTAAPATVYAGQSVEFAFSAENAAHLAWAVLPQDDAARAWVEDLNRPAAEMPADEPAEAEEAVETVINEETAITEEIEISEEIEITEETEAAEKIEKTKKTEETDAAEAEGTEATEGSEDQEVAEEPTEPVEAPSVELPVYEAALASGNLDADATGFAWTPDDAGEYLFALIAVGEDGSVAAAACEFTAVDGSAWREISLPGADYTLHIRAGQETGLPADARFVAEPLHEGDSAYEQYKQSALAAVAGDDESLADDLELLGLFDLTIYDGEAVTQPAAGAPVQVRVDFGGVLDADARVYAVHFPGTGAQPAPTPAPSPKRLLMRSAATLQAASAVNTSAAETLDAENEGNGVVEFTASGFSYYAVLGTVIEKNVLASDGHNYHITVTFGPETGIPEDADLAVEEILEASELYDAYVSKTEDALGMENGSAGYIRLFDISIVDKDDPSVKYQPNEGTTVDVHIELADSESDSLSVVHFADENDSGSVVSAESADGSVRFEAEGFSAYAIVEGPDPAVLKGRILKTLADVSEAVFNEEPLYLSIHNKQGNDVSEREWYFKNTLNNGVFQETASIGDAGKWYFESTDIANEYRIRTFGGQYVKQVASNSNNVTLTDSQNDAAVFELSQSKTDGRFYLKLKGANRWLQHSGSGKGIRFYTDKNNEANSAIQVMLANPPEEDRDFYNLDGKKYGLMFWDEGVAGKALMASSSVANALDAKALPVMSTADNSSQLFVPTDSGISMWTFRWISEDKYYLTADVGGNTQYLKIDASGASLATEASQIQVVPGTGVHAGEICLKSGDTTVTFMGKVADGFSVGGDVGREWLNLVDISDLTTDYFLTYSASKVSVSDASITNGSRVVVYTRAWNEEKLRYDYYAIRSDGVLVPVYESGDNIEWNSGQLNTLLWNFVEYYWEGTTDPNFYYELYNQYSQKYIAPQVTEEQILTDDPIGINMNGRRDGQYYSTILAWDEDNYSYVGLKVEDGRIVTCPKAEAMDFYFAVMQDLNVDDTLTTVKTMDHTQYGITMKFVNFGGQVKNHDGTTTTETQHAVMGDSHFNQWNGVKGLLGTNLVGGYPTATKTGESLRTLFGDASEVNQLFIQSTYDETGYFSFDSTQNFASLQGENFVVYRELGTMDGGSKDTMKHGQFMPYNDLEAGVFASVNPKNLKTIAAANLPDSDPRKYEQLYLVKDPDYYYGMELEASFTKTPSGKDAWGHDIIFEFTGDDDFWLYVDGELVIDLGGIHSALPGSVNFSTGVVKVSGAADTNLRNVFESNYRKRNPNATDAEVNEYLLRYFDEGETVFRDNSTYIMKMFYMERGAGASNLKMRFNLAAVKQGTVQLSKTLEGVDTEDVMAEFPYQIFYKKGDDTEYPLTNALASSDTQNDNYVLYRDTVNPVKYQPSIKIDGHTYEHVFFLKPGEAADISFPEGMTSYRIVECGVNTGVYERVTVNNTVIPGTEVPEAANRKDFGIGYATTNDRPKVDYVNHVNPNAIRELTIQKKLYDETGDNPITCAVDPTEFTFRLYMATEFDEDIDMANMHTYHVKDPDGYFCSWDAAQGKFVRIVDDSHLGGFTDYTELSDEQKAAASFTTSIYGSIGKIQSGYTVVVRDVLAGTRYRVEERKSEIPDGYSFIEYVKNGSTQTSISISDEGVEGLVVSERDENVIVRNLKGWGLRVNKVWRDAEYMSSREDTYFAIFTGTNAAPVLVDGSVRQLPYSANPQTIYWYYDSLPVQGTRLEDYFIREVTGGFSVDADGVVTNYESVAPIGNGETLELPGKQKGEETESSFKYTVRYDDPEIPEGSNVCVQTVTNDRPGIILKKTDWKGDPLKDAVFTLKKGDTLIGEFTSADDGVITTAFLSDGTDYTLTEVSAPHGYYGLQSPITIRVGNGGMVSVTEGELELDYFTLTPAEGTTLATLTIKNHPFSLQVIKKGGEYLESAEPLENIQFKLFRYTTVNGMTGIDLANPVYESLLTNESGVVPNVDENLPAGTYELREVAVPEGYQTLSLPHIKFTISPLGVVTVDDTVETYVHDGVRLTKQAADGSTAYTMEILNHPAVDLTIQKEVPGGADADKEFIFRLVSVEKQANGTKYAWKKLDVNGQVIASTQDDGKPLTTRTDHGEENIFKLKPGQRMVIEAPKNKEIKIEEVLSENDKYVTAWRENVTDGDVSHVTPASGEGTEMLVKLDGDATIVVTNVPEGGITLKKAAQGGTDPLPGAQFQLCEYNDSGSWVAVAEYANIDMTSEGTFAINGLRANTRYRLQEQKAPAGYIIRESYIYFTFNPDLSIALTDDQGAQIETSADSIAAWDVGSKTLTVFNTPGVSLPATGSTGTVPYTAAGALLTGVALILLVCRRRRAAR